MAKAKITAAFHCSLERVWDVVTSLENYSWRSDITEIKVKVAGKEFVEYTKDGYATTFTITAFEPMKKYAFDMDNENMHGRWVGLFSNDHGETVIDFTEDVTAKKIALRPFVGIYLKKQQAAYVAELRKALGV
ncbi:MAG: SRPBCC family protein [Oscillospiraceae bacterium]|nr:SRPBCC family protein [Oscillospiraceae bacterium]